MNAKNFLIELESQNIRFSVKDDELTCNAPTDFFSDETRQQISTLKPGIIAELKKREPFHKLQHESTERLNAACPNDFQFSATDWQQLEQIEVRIHDCRNAGNVEAFKSALADYEQLALSMYQREAKK
jgi:hypothetical protein